MHKFNRSSYIFKSSWPTKSTPVSSCYSFWLTEDLVTAIRQFRHWRKNYGFCTKIMIHMSRMLYIAYSIVNAYRSLRIINCVRCGWFGLGVLATTWSVHISRSNSCRLTSIPCPSEQEVMNYSQPKMVNLDWLYWMMMGNSLYQSNHTLWLWFYCGRSFVHFPLLPVNMTV